MDKEQFRQYIVKAPLQLANLWSQSAENLLFGIAGVETQWYEHCVQLGGGPAYGPYQSEEAPYEDCVKYMCASKSRFNSIMAASGINTPWIAAAENAPVSFSPKRETLIYNLRYATLICRLFFCRFNEELPDAKDYVAMANLHKRLYNTSGGSTDLAKSIKIFEEACS